MDARAIEIAKAKIQSERLKADRLIAIQGNYKNLKEIVLQNNLKNISGILIDLGFSSMEIADQKKGFSFQIDAPLDMRYGEEGVDGGGNYKPFSGKRTRKYFSGIWRRKVSRTNRERNSRGA